jgi:hypothetical protein
MRHPNRPAYWAEPRTESTILEAAPSAAHADVKAPLLAPCGIQFHDINPASRRFTRLTNGVSKKLANHIAAVSLYVAHFNLCRVHESLRITPAMAMGITDHIWTVGELIDTATAEPMEQQAA